MKMNIFLIILFFPLFSRAFCSGEVIVVAGPSCSGKSTISKELSKKLGVKWRYVDFDKVLDFEKKRNENFNEERFWKKYLLSAIRSGLAKGHNIVVDTNMYDENLKNNLESMSKIYIVFVYSPLSVLKTRDSNRNLSLKRSTIDAKRAWDYVRESFDRFFHDTEKIIPKFQYDMCIRTDLSLVGDSVNIILKSFRQVP